ncbi:MAG: tetratricopeptide repeat protein, partial [Nitrospirae bacterium]|nr:tetratricopeptide repeat protein [Nitrospirota bacterium]
MSHKIIALLLAAIAVIAYSPVLNNDFVSYDDYKYTVDNSYVKGGLSVESVKWAITADYFSNWHPLTWISHLADISLYGLNPMGHHLSSLLIHALNTGLLFYVLYLLAGAGTRLWECAFAAALFAVHPLNVESVAWVAERKNVLCTLFWLLSFLAYIYYVRRQTLRRYLMVLLLFSMALMSKPMAVTLPFTLLLIDYWPLGRFNKAGKSAVAKSPAAGLIAEKIPFFLLSVVSAVITVYAQMHEGAIVSFETLPLATRIVNAAMSYAGYIEKLFVPIHLAVFYPYIEIKSPVVITLNALILAGTSVFVVLKRKTAPYLLIGWLWYLGTLVPVIQIVQVGAAQMADRYMYIPAIGLFIMISWGCGDVLAARMPSKKTAAAALGITAVLLLAVMTFRQSGCWKDSSSLYKHAIEVTTANYLAHNNYGQVLMKHGMFDEAIGQFKKGLDIMPENVDLNYNMWLALKAKGTPDDKYLLNASALWFRGDTATLYKNAGIGYIEQRNYEYAVGFLLKSLLINNKDAETFNHLGMALQGRGLFKEAAMSFGKAIGLNPNNPAFHFNKAVVLNRAGDLKAAVAELKETLRLDP